MKRNKIAIVVSIAMLFSLSTSLVACSPSGKQVSGQVVQAGPQGDKGDKGDKGEAGAKGDKGV